MINTWGTIINKLCKDDVKIMPGWFKNDAKIIPTWCQHHPKMILKSSQTDANIIPKWYCRERQLMTATPCFDDTSNEKTIREKKSYTNTGMENYPGMCFCVVCTKSPVRKALFATSTRISNKNKQVENNIDWAKWPSGGVVLSLNYPGTIRELSGVAIQGPRVLQAGLWWGVVFCNKSNEILYFT